MISAVDFDGHSLKFASADLRDDREIVLRAVCGPGGGAALQYASERLRSDKSGPWTPSQPQRGVKVL